MEHERTEEEGGSEDKSAYIKKASVGVAGVFIFLVIYVFAYPILLIALEEADVFDDETTLVFRMVTATIAPLHWLMDGVPLYKSYVHWADGFLS